MEDQRSREPEKEGDKEIVEEAARAVLAGTDSIAVPDDLVRESAEESKPEEAKPEEENRSLYAQIQSMTVAQKVKLAIKGNKDARMILIRAANRLVQRMVLQNPRITEDEILALAKNKSTDDEILRLICENREWTTSYAVRSALVENARTPLSKALRFLPTLGDREIRVLAKSKNVPNVIASQARKILFQKEQFRSASR